VGEKKELWTWLVVQDKLKIDDTLILTFTQIKTWFAIPGYRC